MKRTSIFIAASLVLLPLTVSAAGTSWRSATPLHRVTWSQSAYGQLKSVGQAKFYAFAIARPAAVRIRLDVATGHRAFIPQVVVYQPDAMTFGPPLPMEQPPNTIATVYPGRSHRTQTDSSTLIQFENRIDVTTQLEQAGTYYIAVYNASTVNGGYRLRLGQDHIMADDVFAWPVRWWQDQAFAGWSWRTAVVPLIALLLIWLILQAVHRRHFRPRKKVTKKGGRS